MGNTTKRRSPRQLGGTTLAEHAFVGLEAERERGIAMFGIDIEASFHSWMIDLLGEEKAWALRQEIATTPRHGRVRPEADLADLTSRERQCLTLVACGYSRGEVADILGLSMETAKSHLKLLYPKLRARNMAHAAMIAALIGELDADLIRAHAFRGYESPGLTRPGRPIAA